MQQQNTSLKIGFLRKITNFTIGFLANTVFFGLFFRILGGGWIGASAGAVFGLAAGLFVRKKFKNDPLIKIFGTGVLSSTVVLTVIPVILWFILLNMFQNIAN